MRLEPNISLTTTPGKLPNYKVEVKNINSFKFVEKAINFELKRQEKILENGEMPTQETRGWNEDKGRTFSQRSKEDAHDYRYFPEPDIPPIVMTKDEISKLQEEVPELPDKKLVRFEKEYNLPEYNAEILTRDKLLADYFEETVKKVKDIDAKTIANWIINKKVDYEKVSSEELLKQITASKQVAAIDENELHKFINEVIKENDKAVADYKNGKEASLMFLLGQTMKKIGKKVDTNRVLDALKKKIS